MSVRRPVVVGLLLFVSITLIAGMKIDAEAQHRRSALTVEDIALRSLGLTSAPRGSAITVVRADLGRVEPVLATAAREGGWHPLPEWVESQRFVAAINAAMYEPDGRAAGLMRARGQTLSAVDRPDFGGLFVFDAIAGSAAAAIVGRDCSATGHADALRAFASHSQSLRLLDCHGEAIAWADPSSYPATGIGLGDDGRLVLLHSATPLRMRDLSAALAHPRARIASMIFTEGGVQTSLVARVGGHTTLRAGVTRDDPTAFVALPLVLGLRNRD